MVPIEVESAAVLRVGLGPYAPERLTELRAGYRGSHFFKWDRVRDRIASIPLTEGQEPIGDEVLELRCADAPWLVAPLVLEALLKFFHSHKRPVLTYKPLRIVTRQASDDLLRRKNLPGIAIPSWLERRVSYLFDTRTIYPDFKNPRIGLACDVRISKIISANVRQLQGIGFDPVGHYVETLEERDDPRLVLRRRLVGRVAELQGTKLVFDDHLEGVASVESADAFLEPRQEKVVACLKALFGDKADQVIAYADQAAAALQNGQEQLRRTRQLFDFLRDRELQLAPGVSFKIGQLLASDHAESAWFPCVEVIAKPDLVFDPSGTRTDTWNQRGLDRHGPYDRRTFSPKAPNVAVVCQDANQGQVEQWAARFLEGMPGVGDGKGGAAYEKGFVRRYDFQHAKTTTFTAPGADAASYEAACRRALQEAADRNVRWDLALVQTQDAFHLLPSDENPYLASKALFLKRDVPVQAVEIETMGLPQSQLGYVMNNIGLASYAKMRGIPWLLKAQPTVARELVIGLGSHTVQHSRFGTNERLVGITTVFSADGNYLLENRTLAVPYDAYAGALLEAVKRAVEVVRAEQNWKASDAVRLVFHAFKPFRYEQVERLAEVVGSIGHAAVQYAFLHFAESHAYRIFDPAQKGVRAIGGLKGVFAPQRGLCLHLNDHELLLALVGAREVKKPSDGTPQPVLLRLHEGSTFTDLTYLARQAFSFACHSWRSFFPARLPITIVYSDLIAQQMRSLEGFPGWDTDAMTLGQIGRTPWFL